MSTDISPTIQIREIQGQPLNSEQTHYLSGFFSGLAAQGVTFAEAVATAPKESEDALPLITEERIKREENPLESYYKIVENARNNQAPDKEDTFRFKWNGLFYLTPVKDAFMCRLRIPGGVVKSFQLKELANISKKLTTGYVQITTRANFQIRLIQPKDAPEVLRKIQNVGLHTKGSGADNIRNITANPTAGIDPYELIDVMPYVEELAQYIISHQEFYDLPRKFNIAFDGGGLIGSVEDTNDIGVKAVAVEENDQGIKPGIYFQMKLGGATGHKAFARDCGILIPPEDLIRTLIATVRIFIKNGNRTDRKRARLKHLLEKWTLTQYIAEVEKVLGHPLLTHAANETGRISCVKDAALPPVPHSHVGVFEQKQRDLFYIGVAFPVGQITPDQMIRLAELADEFGSGEIRLTVWQNLIIPNIKKENVLKAQKSIEKMGLHWKQSNLSSGVIACTGNRYCKYSSTDTKGHAQNLIRYLEKKKIQLDQPINIHFTGCPHSCAQHYMGDIGCLGTKASTAGAQTEAYHIFVGGGFGSHQAIGRQVFQGLSVDELNPMIERMIRTYLEHRENNESFLAFTTRHDLNALQVLFSSDPL